MRILFLLFVFFGFTIIHAQDNTEQSHFIINGQILGRDTGIIKLNYLNKDGSMITDTTRIKNGYFFFSGFINQPYMASFIGNVKSRSVDDANYAEAYIEPTTMSIVLHENNFKSLKLNGSFSQIESENLKNENFITDSLRNEKYLQRLSFQKRLSASKDSISKESILKEIDEIKTQMSILRNEKNKVEFNFMLTHPDSYVCPTLMLYHSSYLPLDSIKLFYNSWTKRIKNSQIGKYIESKILTKEGSLIGLRAKEFSVKDINGRTIMFPIPSENKIILLDFWASWCIPCRQGFPHLKELYKKYHAKGFEIFGVSIDLDKNSWQKAIIEDSIGSWRQLLGAVDFKKPNPDDLINKFEVNAVPMQYLMNPKGIIIGKWEGQSQQNEEELDKLLKKEIDIIQL